MQQCAHALFKAADEQRVVRLYEPMLTACQHVSGCPTCAAPTDPISHLRECSHPGRTHKCQHGSARCQTGMQRPTCDGLRERDYASGGGGSADVGRASGTGEVGSGGSGNGATGMRTTDRKCTGCTSSGRQASAVRFAETWRRAPSTVNRDSPHGASECAGRQAGRQHATYDTRH